jgi:hypothetical protein
MDTLVVPEPRSGASVSKPRSVSEALRIITGAGAFGTRTIQLRMLLVIWVKDTWRGRECAIAIAIGVWAMGMLWVWAMSTVLQMVGVRIGTKAGQSTGCERVRRDAHSLSCRNIFEVEKREVRKYAR